MDGSKKDSQPEEGSFFVRRGNANGDHGTFEEALDDARRDASTGVSRRIYKLIARVTVGDPPITVERF